jgi:hypothetical protein
MKKKSRHESNFTSPRLRGEVGAKCRVRGTVHEPFSRQRPLTPTLSPQERGEGAH